MGKRQGRPCFLPICFWRTCSLLAGFSRKFELKHALAKYYTTIKACIDWKNCFLSEKQAWNNPASRIKPHEKSKRNSKMVAIAWTEKADSDMEQIIDYWASVSENAARLQIKRIFDKVEILETFPNSGRVVPEFGHPRFEEHKSRGDLVFCPFVF
ncbi:MAG: type II toxin-antitoxin system RelE/ParE family toxin [Lewinellaceae bacterium]|nr:type II toxin-antitoxin system RelE/ParE family toxin [Lewinellaceae bacterium]